MCLYRDSMAGVDAIRTPPKLGTSTRKRLLKSSSWKLVVWSAFFPLGEWGFSAGTRISPRDRPGGNNPVKS